MDFNEFERFLGIREILRDLKGLLRDFKGSLGISRDSKDFLGILWDFKGFLSYATIHKFCASLALL